jgi:hypothetical protein
MEFEMEENDRGALLAAMYQDDGQQDDGSETHVDVPGFNRSRIIKVGIIAYEVPTVEYVQRLEQLIANQSSIIGQQKQSIERLKAFVLSTRSFIRRQTSRITEMQDSIDGKVDSRDFT